MVPLTCNVGNGLRYRYAIEIMQCCSESGPGSRSGFRYGSNFNCSRFKLKKLKEMIVCEIMLLSTLKRNILRIFYTRPESAPDLHPETKTNPETDGNQNFSNVGARQRNRNNRHGSTTLFKYHSITFFVLKFVS